MFIKEMKKMDMIKEVAEIKALMNYEISENINEILENETKIISIQGQKKEWNELVEPLANMKRKKWEVEESLIIANNICRQVQWMIHELEDNFSS